MHFRSNVDGQAIAVGGDGIMERRIKMLQGNLNPPGGACAVLAPEWRPGRRALAPCLQMLTVGLENPTPTHLPRQRRIVTPIVDLEVCC